MEAILGVICLSLLIYIAWLERSFAKERSELLTRIQAPQAAPYVLGDETVEQQYDTATEVGV